MTVFRTRVGKSMLVGVCLLITVLAAAQQAEMEGLDQLRQQWAELYNQGDLESLVDLYSEDARYYTSSGDVLEGRSAILEGFQQEVEAIATQLEGQTVQIDVEGTTTEILGDTAYEVGTYTVSANGQTVDQGNYLVISKMVGGEWQITHHMETSSAATMQSGDGDGG